MPISEATRRDAERLVRRYPVARSALLPVLHLVQSEEGYVSDDGIAFCAELLGLTKAEVGAVSTFYTMYKRERFGDWLLSVCTNPTCKVAGGQDIYDAYVRACDGTVDVEAGVMVEHVECLGICDAAPVVQINYEMYGPLGPEQAMDLLERAKAGDPPPSDWSGAVPPTFREVERELSGIEDGLDEELTEAARLQTLYEVPPAHRTGETDIPVTHPGGDPAGHGGAVFREEAGLDLAPVAGGGAAPGSVPAAQDQPGSPEAAPETPQEAAPDAPARGSQELGDEDADAGAGDEDADGDGEEE